MNQPTSSELPPSTLADHLWASDAISNMINGIALNRMLVETGYCPKYLMEMQDVDLPGYVKLLRKYNGKE